MDDIFNINEICIKYSIKKRSRLLKISCWSLNNQIIIKMRNNNKKLFQYSLKLLIEYECLTIKKQYFLINK